MSISFYHKGINIPIAGLFRILKILWRYMIVLLVLFSTNGNTETLNYLILINIIHVNFNFCNWSKFLNKLAANIWKKSCFVWRGWGVGSRSACRSEMEGSRELGINSILNCMNSSYKSNNYPHPIRPSQSSFTLITRLSKEFAWALKYS